MNTYSLTYGSNFSSLFSDLFNSVETNIDLRRSFWKKDENKYTLSLEIPGISKDELQLDIEKNIIYLKAQSKKNSSFNYEAKFLVPENSEVKNIDGVLENGVLEISVPIKSPERRNIKIN